MAPWQSVKLLSSWNVSSGFEAGRPLRKSASSSLIGPPGYIKERIAAYKESGVTILNITPMGPDPVKVVEQVKEWAEAA